MNPPVSDNEAPSHESPGRLVALHGFTGCGADWELLAEPLRELGFDFIAPDLPGHGRTSMREIVASESKAQSGSGGGSASSVDSEASASSLTGSLLPATPGLAPFADWVARTQLGGELPSVLIGYSMGGRIALETALRHPDRVRALVLVGATAGVGRRSERSERRLKDQATAEKIEREGIAAFADYWEDVEILRTQRRIAEPWRSRLRARRREQDAQELAAALRAGGTGAMEARWGDLSRLTMPVLVAWGAEDMKFRRIGERLLEGLPNAAPLPIAGAGHTAHLESPKAFMEGLLRWLPRAGIRVEREVLERGFLHHDGVE